MTTEEIDDALDEWRSRLKVSSQNLIAIDDLFTFRRLNGEGGVSAPVLTGVTALQVPAAVTAIGKLWEYQQMLGAIVEDAEDLRKSLPSLFGADKIRQQITSILQGASIDFPAIETPLAERGLLTPTQQQSSVTPHQLLEIMSRTFEVSRAIILQVDEAWSKLDPQLAALNEEADRLQALAVAAGEAAIPELAQIRQRIVDINQCVATDPLGAGINAEQSLLPLMQQVKQRLELSAAARQKVVTNLATCAALMADLEKLQIRTCAAATSLQQHVTTESAPLKMLDDTVVTELKAWLNTLTTSFEAGNWRPTAVGLERWQASAGAALDSVQAALTRANYMLEAASELKGRLLAQKARAEGAVRRGTVIPEALNALADEAEQTLRLKPVPLDRVQHLVEDYEKKLGALL